MRVFTNLALGLAAGALLAACGGGGDGDQSPKVTFSKMVSFGDSLSDVGTYKVGTVAALSGGKYTVNGSTAKNWTEVLAAQLGVAAPCAAETGLDGSSAAGFSVAPVTAVNCTNFAQGGSRVTLPFGPGNKNLGGANATLGQLTIPVATQISRHLANVTQFSGQELVTVMAGGNDAFIQLGVLSVLGTASFAPYAQGIAGWTSGEISSVTGVNAFSIAATIMNTKMATAGTELANLINNQIIANGAKYVVVVNLPNLSRTPFGDQQESASPGMRSLIDTMVQSFNNALATGLGNNSKTKLVDAYTVSADQVANPAQYGLTNVSNPACDLTAPSPNALGSSLVCNASNTINNGATDVSTYLFADTVHPTPLGYRLLAQLVAKDMAVAGWL